VSSPNSYI
jgi:hypothetical protein